MWDDQKLPEGDGWGGGAVASCAESFFVQEVLCTSPAQVIGDGRTLPAQDSALEFGTFGALRPSNLAVGTLRICLILNRGF